MLRRRRLTVSLALIVLCINPPPLKGGARGGISSEVNSESVSRFAAPSCRVFNHLPSGATNVGSGTLIDVSADGGCGLVLTCAHLWSEGSGRVVVQFADGRRHGALLVAMDRAADLAAVQIAKPQAAAAAVAAPQAGRTEAMTACGFGGAGEFRCVAGRVLGEAEGPGQVSARLAGAVRSGDSGGGAFDAQGRLVGVVWGESGGVTYISTGGPLRRFLDRVLGRRDVVSSPRFAPPVAARPNGPCPDGRCPLAPPPAAIGAAPAGRSPAAIGGGAAVRGGCDCDAQWAALEARLDALRREPPPAALGPGRVIGGLAATALGVSGPAGWAVLAGASIGSWLLGRRMKRRAARRSKPAPPQEATAAAANGFHAAETAATFAAHVALDQRQPIERDDREARELLRLSQLEGRDPLQDALAGRLALDRLDAAAEGDADPQHARWADALRRQLRERFNEIAPTKFQTNAECQMGSGG